MPDAPASPPVDPETFTDQRGPYPEAPEEVVPAGDEVARLTNLVRNLTAQMVPCPECEGSGIVEENHGQGQVELLGCQECRGTGFTPPPATEHPDPLRITVAPPYQHGDVAACLHDGGEQVGVIYANTTEQIAAVVAQLTGGAR